jgi:hypothetical protein
VTLTLSVTTAFLVLVVIVVWQFITNGDLRLLIAMQQTRLEQVTGQRDTARQAADALARQRIDALTRPHPKLALPPHMFRDQSFIDEPFLEQALADGHPGARLFFTDAEVDARCAGLERFFDPTGDDLR